MAKITIEPGDKQVVVVTHDEGVHSELTLNPGDDALVVDATVTKTISVVELSAPYEVHEDQS